MASLTWLKDRDIWLAFPFALSILLGVLQLLQVSGLVYSVMEHRMWFDASFSVGFDLSWLIIGVCVACLVLLVARRSLFVVLPLAVALSGFVLGFDVAVPLVALAVSLAGLLAFRNWRLVVFWVLGLVSLVELGAVLYWLALAPLGLESPLADVASLEESLFYLLTPFSFGAMVAIIVLSLVGPLRALVGRLRSGGIKGPGSVVDEGAAKEAVERVDDAREQTKSGPHAVGRRTSLILVAILAYAAFSALYPSLPGINPNRADIGVDVSSYLSDLGNIASNFSYIFKAEGGSRPIFFVFLTAFQRVFGLAAFDAITYAPIVLAPVLALSVFFLAREVLGDDRYALWASFFTVAGFQLVVGMFSFFLTNMLGLAIAYAMLTLVFRFFRRPRILELVGAAVLAVALLFTHPWTFDQYAAALVPVVAYMALRGENREVRLLSRIGVVASVVLLGAAEVFKSSVLGGVGGFSSLSVLFLNFTTLEGFIPAFYGSVFYYNGLFANLVLLVIVAVGIYAWRIRGVAGIYFASFLWFSTFAYLLVEMDTKERLLFNYPFGILAAVGLMRLSQTKGERLKSVIPVFVALALLAYQLRSLANLV